MKVILGFDLGLFIVLTIAFIIGSILSIFNWVISGFIIAIIAALKELGFPYQRWIIITQFLQEQGMSDNQIEQTTLCNFCKTWPCSCLEEKR